MISEKGISCMRDFEQNPNEWLDGDEPQQLGDESEKENAEQTAPTQEDAPSVNRNSGYGYDYDYPEGYSRPGHQKPKKQKNGTSVLLIAFCLVLFIFIGISVGAIFDVGRDINDPNQSTSSSSTSDRTNAGTSNNGSDTAGNANKPSETAPGAAVIAPDTEEYVSIFREVANKCLKTVVEIYVQTPSGGGAGSGVIYDPNGYIVTNYHVANETRTSITVILYDGSQYEAKYIYGDELSDLAVIKIEKTDCDYAVFGDSDHMTYGDLVLAIGNPKGLGLSVTDGIISRPGESVTFDDATMTLLRTSAAINNGNSGGGLFNLKGELIGIVNAKLASSSIDNIGYAIPSTTVVKCINDLKDYGYITGRAYLGIDINTKQYTAWPYQYTLLQVKEIFENGSAANSDLRVGDILYRYQGTNISSFDVLTQQLTKYSVGDTIKLTVLRPTIEFTGNNLQQYINSAEEVEITITFVEFNPNA